VADSTQQTVQIAAVLVVGGSRSLIKTVRRAAHGVQCTEVVTCAVREASTRAAELRPLAIVLNEDVYAFDAAEFDALARDVRAELVVIATDARDAIRSADALRTTLTTASERRRPR